MPSPGRIFQNITPFYPRFGAMHNYVLKDTENGGGGGDQIINRISYGTGAPGSGGVGAPAMDGGDWGDWYVDLGNDQSGGGDGTRHVWRKGATWTETATVPAGESMDGFLPGSVSFGAALRDGSPSLIGFESFSDPAVPPNKYLKRVTDGGYSLLSFPNSAACEFPDCLGAGTFTFSGEIGGVPGAVYYNGSISPFGAVAIECHFIGGEELPLGAYVIIDQPGGGSGTYEDGDTISFTPNVQATYGFYFTYAGQQSMPGNTGCLLPGLSFVVEEDTWDKTEIYDQDTGDLTVTDNSTHKVWNWPKPFPPTLISSETPIPGCADGPAISCYNYVDITADHLQRVSAPNGCNNTGISSSVNAANQPPWGGSGADPKEVISLPDDEDHAITRWRAANPWGSSYGEWTGGWGATRARTWRTVRTSGFSFEIGDAKVAVTAGGLVPGDAYEFAIDFYQRSGGGDWSLSSSYTSTQTSDVSGHASIVDVDVPQTEGKETIAIFRSLTPVS